MELSHDVERLLKQRYYHEGETWSDLVNRVVEHVCIDERKWFRDTVRDHILHRVWLPNSPCLVGAKTKTGGLFACFTVGPDEDTLENHVEVLGHIAAVGKRGGGCGFTGTNIRAEGSPVAGSVHGQAYGPNNWAVRVSEYLDMITQGHFRKMALMYTLRSDHPDLEKFIELKQTTDERFAYNFNQSIMATDSWMRRAVGAPNGEQRTLKRIAYNAHNNGDPGLLFHTTINEKTPYKDCGCPPIEATNPCGEQPLPSYGSCNLASINISHDMFFDNEGRFDFTKLSYVSGVITRFLDDVGSRNVFPNKKFETWYKKHRPIGIGIMGFADALLRLGLAYGKVDSIEFLENVMQVIYKSAVKMSELLGEERGVPEHCDHVNRRNITLTTVAPTGSIGFIANCSHGIEPIFSPTYQRTDEKGETYLFQHPERDKSFFVSAINKDPQKTPSWEEHVDIQAAAQKWCDSAVSKTINLPYEATVHDVYSAMVYAWESGCKGITVYRDGSRQFQVLEDIKEEDQEILDCPTGVCEI